MERQRGIKGLSIVALLVAIVGLSIAFAALSTTLTINGTAKVEASNWDVHYETTGGSQSGTVNGAPTGKATEVHPATLSATTVSGYEVVLKEPGDKMVYTWDVVNAGDIDATIETFIKPNPVCTPVNSEGQVISEPTSEQSAAASLVCNNLTYTLENTTLNAAVAQGQDLLKKTNDTPTKQRLVLTIGYDISKSTTTVPGTSVKITSFDTTATSTAAGNAPQASATDGLWISTVYAQK